MVYEWNIYYRDICSTILIRLNLSEAAVRSYSAYLPTAPKFISVYTHSIIAYISKGDVLSCPYRCLPLAMFTINQFVLESKEPDCHFFDNECHIKYQNCQKYLYIAKAMDMHINQMSWDSGV